MKSPFRKKLRNWAAIGVLLLALLAMVVTGFGTDGMGGLGGISPGAGGATTLAKVDDGEVTEAELSQQLNRIYAQAQAQQPGLTMEAFLAQGAFDGILSQLITGEALMAFGKDQGVVVSDRMIDRVIVNIPQFRNFTGQFDDATFRQALAQQNMTERDLREEIARSLMARQLALPLSGRGFVPDGVVREYANLQLERRRGTIGVIPAELMAQGLQVTDAEIATFYRTNGARFTIPERRVVRYAVLGAEQVGAAGQATEQEIAAYYRQNQAAYAASETRNLQHVVLQDQAAAQAFVQRVRGGASFTDAASQAGFAAGDISFPNQTRAGFAGETTPQVAAAAFGAAQGALAGPIRSELGFHLVLVEAINAVPARSLEAARSEIVQRIEQRKRRDALDAMITRVEDQLSDGASFEEVVRAERLNFVSTPPVTAAGQVPGQAQWQAPAELQPLLTSAFEMDPDDLEPVVEALGPERFALLGVERVIPAAPPPLAQIRDQVRQALLLQRGHQRARALAVQIVNRINGGTAPAAAFAAAQPRPPAPETVNLRRFEMMRAGEQAPPPLLALFSLPEGRARLIEAPNGAGWFVVHHAERTPGDASTDPRAIASVRSELTGATPDELSQQFFRAVELAVGVERNEQAIREARQRLGGSATGN
ncbi:MAG TPA: peptidyl-prolyl cis-trans isomerase [Allosphingosinicella sp.]|nr:peptidyl-prolyl cis-trans isomerase [Allosphingosinicella sp.]